MDKKRLVRDIYHRGIITCKPDATLQEVVRIMAESEIHAVIVAEREGEAPVGIVSHTDAIAHYGDDLTTVRAREVMTPHVVSVRESAPIEAAGKKLLESGFNRLLVVGEDDASLGILSTTDVIREMHHRRRLWTLD